VGQVFISYVEEDADVVAEIVHELEATGLTAWYYHRDSLPGPSYPAQIASEVEGCQAIVVIISPDSINSEQVTSEIVRGFELGKPFVPVLRDISHAGFQRKQPEWRGALRAATSIQVPAEGVRAILPRILGGLQALGIAPGSRPKRSAQPAPSSPLTTAAAAGRAAPVTGHTASSRAPGLDVQLTATFDQEAYPAGDDPLAYCLVELMLEAEGEAAVEGVDADLALVLDVSGSMDKPNRYPLLREAVRQLVAGLAPTDRISITLFSDRSETVVPPISGADAAEKASELLQCMDRSQLLFGPKTLLAPALALGLEALGPAKRSAGRVRRVYVLTDGELHDSPACEIELEGFRSCQAEVHVYGFGDEFNAAALKRLVSDQIGGTVKPICNEQDIVRTFAHLARVNRRLVGQEGKLTVTFSPGVVCGDAWVFRPAGRYLGTVRDHRVEHVFGGLESGRVYALLLEVRLPPDGGATHTPAAEVEAGWVQAGKPTSQRIQAAARRGPASRPATPPVPVRHVRCAFDALNVLRNENDAHAVLASMQARRELAVLEGRDPNLIAALDKMIANLAESGQGQRIDEAKAQLTPEEQLYLDSDSGTCNQ
jgi:Mg-chelatase subunit ChlD